MGVFGVYLYDDFIKTDLAQIGAEGKISPFRIKKNSLGVGDDINR